MAPDLSDQERALLSRCPLFLGVEDALLRSLPALPGVTANPAGGQVFQEFMVDFRATGKSVAEIHQALLARNIFGGVDLGKVFPAYAGYALYCVSDTTTAADIDTLCAALHDILGGTGA